MISHLIYASMGGVPLSTTDIVSIGAAHGFNELQVLGGIGYLRSKGMLTIVGSTVSPIGRKEHLFI